VECHYYEAPVDEVKSARCHGRRMLQTRPFRMLDNGRKRRIALAGISTIFQLKERQSRRDDPNRNVRSSVMIINLKADKSQMQEIAQSQRLN